MRYGEASKYDDPVECEECEDEIPRWLDPVFSRWVHEAQHWALGPTICTAPPADGDNTGHSEACERELRIVPDCDKGQ